MGNEENQDDNCRVRWTHTHTHTLDRKAYLVETSGDRHRYTEAELGRDRGGRVLNLHILLNRSPSKTTASGALKNMSNEAHLKKIRETAFL